MLTATQSGGRLYTTQQATRGQALYTEQCLSCHGSLDAFVPEVAVLLGDHIFRNKWRGRPLSELFGFILESMPQNSPGTLSPQQTAELVAYILSGHRLPAGDVALVEDVETLKKIPFDP